MCGWPARDRATPDCLTLDVLSALAQADALVHDALVSEKVWRWRSRRRNSSSESAAAGCRSRRRTSTRCWSRLAKEGRKVVRLKGGAPAASSARGGEEALALAAENIPFRVLPGVTSALRRAGLGGHSGNDARRQRRGDPRDRLRRDERRPAWTGRPLPAPASRSSIYMGLTHMQATVADLLGRRTGQRHAGGARRERDAARGAHPSSRRWALWSRRRRGNSVVSPALIVIGAYRVAARHAGRRTMSARAIIIGAPRSGSGKTSVTIGLLRALKRRGLRGTAARSRDRTISTRASTRPRPGRDGVNLDSWAMPPALLAALAAEAARRRRRGGDRKRDGPVRRHSGRGRAARVRRPTWRGCLRPAGAAGARRVGPVADRGGGRQGLCQLRPGGEDRGRRAQPAGQRARPGAATTPSPIDQWAPEDVEAHIAFQRHVGTLLEENGESVDTGRSRRRAPWCATAARTLAVTPTARTRDE